MIDLGVVKPGSTIRIPFSTFDKDDGSSITMTAFAVADILIYKDGNTTERASTSGFTATTDFDARTGKQLIVIDLADNTTADFFAAGSEYLVAVDAVTVDAVTVGGWVARFRIGYPGAILDTTIATLASQVSFTLTIGPAEAGVLIGCCVVIHDAASAVQMCFGHVEAYDVTTKTVTLAVDPGVFTIAAKDNVSFMPPAIVNKSRIGRAVNSISTGTVGSGSTTTSVVSSVLSPVGVDTNQFRAQILCFDKDTTTAGLRGQKTDITASTNAAAPVFTVTALTTAPVSGDTFAIQ
jgi:hypothetical protein